MLGDVVTDVLTSNPLITAFAVVGILVWFSYLLSTKLSRGQLHGSAIAISIGLILAYVGGAVTGGSNGVADFPILAGIGLMGGAMFRDFAIVATAFGAELGELKAAGVMGAGSIVLGVVLSFSVGVITALAFGYTDPVSVSTIGAGAATYIVGPVTGTALGAEPDVIALSVAAGLTKSIIVMVSTPLVAGRIGLDNPYAAMIYGGLMGTTSGWRSCSNGSKACALWRDDGDLLHGRRMSVGSFDTLFLCSGHPVSSKARHKLLEHQLLNAPVVSTCT